MVDLLKSLSSWGGVVVWAGLTTGHGTDAAARRPGNALGAASVSAASVSAAPGLGAMGHGAFGERADVPSEALAATLSSGTGLGGEILRPLSAL